MRNTYYVIQNKELREEVILNSEEAYLFHMKQNPDAVVTTFGNLASAKKFVDESKLKSRKKRRIRTEKATLDSNEFVDHKSMHYEVFRLIKAKRNGSNGESKVEAELAGMRLRYEKEVEVIIDGYKHIFDFAIYWKRKLFAYIEFDGIQHFESVSDFGGKREFEKRQFLDKVKNDYCLKKRIKLVRISYLESQRIGEILSNEFAVLKPDKDSKINARRKSAL